MAKVTFNEHELECLRFLASRYDKHGDRVGVQEMPGYEQHQREGINEVVERFRRLGPVEWHTNMSFKVLPTILEIAHQIDNPPAPDYWQELFKWWFRSKWRVGITVVTIVLPLVVTWIEMMKTVLRWMGVLS